MIIQFIGYRFLLFFRQRVPFSSDILLMGYLYAGGDYFLSFLVATIGNWLGGLTSYWIGYSGKWEWIEKWFNVKKECL